MGNLSVVNPIAMDLELADESAGIFAAVMENLDYCRVFQNVFQDLWEFGKFDEIENEAVAANANLRYYKTKDTYLDQG